MASCCENPIFCKEFQGFYGPSWASKTGRTSRASGMRGTPKRQTKPYKPYWQNLARGLTQRVLAGSPAVLCSADFAVRCACAHCEAYLWLKMFIGPVRGQSSGVDALCAKAGSLFDESDGSVGRNDKSSQQGILYFAGRVFVPSNTLLLAAIHASCATCSARRQFANSLENAAQGSCKACVSETLWWRNLQRALLSAGLSNVVLSAEIKLQLADMLVDEAVARVSSMITATTATTGVEELLREQYAVPRRLLCWRHTPAYLTGNDLRDLQMTHLLDNDMPVSLTGDDVLDVEMSHSTPVAAHVNPTPTSISLDSVAVGGQLPLTMRP